MKTLSRLGCVRVLCTATCLSVSLTAGSQTPTPPTRVLGPKLAEGSELFSQVRGFRELSDGRLILTDQVEKKVVMLDLVKHTAVHLGHVGPGPGEYQSATDLSAMAGDTTLLGDAMRGLNALTIITPDGKLADRALLPDGVSISYVSASNATGYLYVPEMRIPASATASDSAPVYRINMRKRTMDTAFFVRVIPARHGMPRDPYNPRHQWAVGADGRIAIVDVERYQVTWILPNGKRKTGAAIPYEKIPVTQKDQDEFRSLARRYQGIGISGMGGPYGQLPQGAFPSVKPPYFANDAVRIAPNYELWVRRSQRSGDVRPLHDIIDGEGNRIATITLPENTKLIGLGKFGVYLARYDDDDLIHIERYAYPK